MRLFITVQINEPYVLLLLKNFNYPVQLTTSGPILSPSMWNPPINKWVSFDENLCWHFFGLSYISSPLLNGPFLNHCSRRGFYLDFMTYVITDPDSLFTGSNHFNPVWLMEGYSKTPVDCMIFLKHKIAVIGSALLNIREEFSSLWHNSFSRDLMSSDDQTFIGFLLLTCESTEDTTVPHWIS